MRAPSVPFISYFFYIFSIRSIERADQFIDDAQIIVAQNGVVNVVETYVSTYYLKVEILYIK